MNLDRLVALTQLPPAALRGLVPEFLAGYIADPAAAEASRTRIGGFLAGVPDDAVKAMIHHLAACGTAPIRWDADPTARTLSRLWCRDVLVDGGVTGLEHLDGPGPTMVVCNHRSYLDTTATDALLAWHGRADLADRMAAVAGPKVYADLFRRFAAACLTTLPAPQSSTIDGAARLAPRELARLAQQAIQQAHDATAAGAIVLLYPEGSRTRTGRLRPFLPAVWRYLAIDGLRVVPAAILGTDDVLGVGADRLTPGRVSLTFGPPRVIEARGARDALQVLHGDVAALLPDFAQPDPADVAAPEAPAAR